MEIYYENLQTKSEKRIREYQRLFQEQWSARRQDHHCSADLEHQNEKQVRQKCADHSAK